MNFTLNVLGTASALPTAERYPSAQVLDVRGRLFMIDCGEAAQMRLRKAGISFLKIEHICLSHIHGDHLFGIFGLLSTMIMLGRSSQLNIYAPESFSPVLEFFLEQFGEGIHFDINYVPLKMKQPELLYQNRKMELLAFPLSHRVDSFGFLFREKMPQHNVRKETIERYGLSLAEIGALKRGEDVVRPDCIISNDAAAYVPYEPRSYAYCSDTTCLMSNVRQLEGVDLLFHEATFASDNEARAQETFHSTARQAALLAQDAKVGQLIIGHFSARYENENLLLKEAQSIFPNTILAKENLKLSIKNKPH